MEKNWTLYSSLLDESEGVAFKFNREVFLRNVESINKAFTSQYRNFRLGYSYKTNYLPVLCDLAGKNSLYAEVVSGMEYELAKILGNSGAEIIFNGPVKSECELLKAFSDGALVNVDNLGEAFLIFKLSEQYPDIVKRVGLRCNLDFKWRGRESRFGLSETSGELEKAISVLRKSNGVRIEGLHCHTSFDRTPESYGQRIRRLIQISDRYLRPEELRFLDVGGGMIGPIPADLATQLKTVSPNYDDYAKEICEPIIKRYGIHGPQLIIEPGVGLVADVFEYIYRVEHVKRVGDKWFAVTNGAAHQIKIVPSEINLPTEVLSNPTGSIEGCLSGTPIDVVGFTCLEHDVIYRGFSNKLKRGDILVTRNVGAYSMVIASDFIRTSPPVFELSESGWKCFRMKSSLSDFLKGFTW